MVDTPVVARNLEFLFDRLLGPIIEEIVATERISVAPRVVTLACGHKTITKAHRRAPCQRCREMLWRSVTNGSSNYVAFRYDHAKDTMTWGDDPCQQYNERP